MKLKLTDKAIKKECRPPRPDERTKSGAPVLSHTYYDEDVTSFCLVVRRPKGTEINATFMVIRSVHGKNRKVKIARYGQMTVEQARKRAREIVVELDKERDAPPAPADAKPNGKDYATVTVADALAEHLADLRRYDRSPRYIKMMQDEVSRHRRTTRRPRTTCSRRWNACGKRPSGSPRSCCRRQGSYRRATRRTRLANDDDAQAPAVEGQGPPQAGGP